MSVIFKRSRKSRLISKTNVKTVSFDMELSENKIILS